MSEELTLLEAEGRLKRQRAAAFLRDLADKLEHGRVILQRGEERVTLDIPDSVTLEIEAEQETKEGRSMRSLEVEIEWVEGE